jgi:N-methylhydantoinase A/oxoprolinase/acetone carboxylase beta subunit/N-methylhydantoinase B/oxoprolinase/acetone carboxylase alpha subunit
MLNATSTAQHALGIDIGGTFTDLVALNLATGTCQTAKVLTTPANPQAGVAHGLAELLPMIGGSTNIGRVVHATTLFSNAVIERKGAKTGLITTAGFRDTLELGRERKYDIYDLFLRFPIPLVERSLRLEIPERIGADAAVLTTLDETATIAAANALAAAGVESIAIAFLNAHINPTHEQTVAALISERHPGLSITLSSDVSREPGEFERTSTAVINAFIKPLAGRYIDGLVSVLQAAGVSAPLMLMLSNGGLTHVQEARRVPVQLLESGPAAGALSAALIGGAAGEARLLAFDMGGTTAKIAIVDNGAPEVAYRFEAARERRFAPGSGLPVNLTTVELVEIGAGGGSIAHCDTLGLLKVGPESASAVPGPACYGRGGTEPTVTDADLLLGYLDPTGFSSSGLTIDVAQAASAAERIGKTLNLSSQDAALGIHEVVCETMARAAQVHLAKKGRDPRDYTLYATGGAAPVHACAVAARLGISRVIIPPAAGVASALGLAVAPARVDRTAAVGGLVYALTFSTLDATYRSLEADAITVVAASAGDDALTTARRLAELRYVGQGAVLVVDITQALIENDPALSITLAFHAAHEQAYGRRLDTVPVELMTARITVQAPTVPEGLRPRLSEPATADTPERTRPARLAGWQVPRDVPIYTRSALALNQILTGAAIIEEGQSTTVLPPNAALSIDDVGNMVIDIAPADGARATRTADLDDPIHLEILWNRMIAAVDEAAASLLRSAFSTVVRESYDFSCVVTDAKGNALAQASDSIPSFIGTLPDTVKHFITAFPPETLSPGDVLITNDPHMGTGHLPDISVCRPLYSHGILVGFAASTAHAPDIGGKIRSPEPREVYEEGLQIPLLKLHEAGRPNQTLLSILRKNVRMADQVEGDLEAQLGALAIMERRIDELIATYQLPDLAALSDAVRKRTETAVRQAITALPDGRYGATVQTDGLTDTPLEIRVEVEIKGDAVHIDFAGSSDQVPKAVNCPLCYTRAMSSYAIKAALAPELPNNDGALQPITVTAPQGSIVNPLHPASVGSRVLTGHYIPALVMDALAGIAPARVLAGAGSPIWCVNINGSQPDGSTIAGLFFFNGGMGASAQGDGLACVSWPSNISSTPAEEIEHRLPIRVLKRALRENSGGPGRFTGGQGQEVELEYTGSKPGVVAFLAERTKAPANGIAGGGVGAPGRLEIDGKPVDPKMQHIVQPGSRIMMATPGGGGYGTAAMGRSGDNR